MFETSNSEITNYQIKNPDPNPNPFLCKFSQEHFIYLDSTAKASAG